MQPASWLEIRAVGPAMGWLGRWVRLGGCYVFFVGERGVGSGDGFRTGRMIGVFFSWFFFLGFVGGGRKRKGGLGEEDGWMDGEDR